jgi:polysaccharide biosynthesis transport protein
VQPSAPPVTYAAEPPALPGQAVPPAIEAAAPIALPRPWLFPRELRDDELRGLLTASDDGSRLAILLLLRGLDVDEALAARASDFDATTGRLLVRGASPREVVLDGALRALVERRVAGSGGNDALVGDAQAAAGTAGLDTTILCAAHDAGLDDAASVNAPCLRHTYVAFLVRQGLRFADLGRIVGTLPPDALRGYTALSPAGERLSRDAIDESLPAVRALAAG